VLFAVGLILVAKYSQIEAKLWHWKHGYSTIVYKYEVPVPPHWLINWQDSDQVDMTNTVHRPFPRDSKLHVRASIFFGILSYPSFHVDDTAIERWVASQRQIMDREGIAVRVEEKLSIDGQQLRCIGGEFWPEIPRKDSRLPDSNMLSVQCRSKEGIEIRFDGEHSDLPDFYSLVSSIHKVR
jgi:hypothetical protein